MCFGCPVIGTFITRILSSSNQLNELPKKKKNTADSEEIYWLRSFENILPDLDY